MSILYVRDKKNGQLTPVPMFVGSGGSDSGGETSWNDITDKPFGAEVVVCYDNPNMQLDDFGEYNEYIEQDFLIPGETYEVECKGVTYELECFAFSSDCNRLEGPKIIISTERWPNNRIEMLVTTLNIADEYEVISFKVSHRKSIKTLDSKYLPLEEIVEAVTDAIPDSGGNVDQSGGLSDTAKALLITILRNAVYSTDQSANITALEAALATGGGGSVEPDEPDTPDVPDEPVIPEKTLTSISATYSGGDVAVGTAVSALSGIVVTAHYSDGSTAPVTGYTLSGTIAEGSNTVTVTYEGKTATFTVTGVTENGGDTENRINIITDYDGWINGKTINGSWGDIRDNAEYSVTDYISVNDGDTVIFVTNQKNYKLLFHCYDSTKVWLGSVGMEEYSVAGGVYEFAVLPNTAYILYSMRTNLIGGNAYEVLVPA